MFREILSSVFTILTLEMAKSQDICRFSSFPIPEADFFACQRFVSGREPIHSVELSCPGSRISVGKLELGYRDRRCKNLIRYIGCCFGSEIPKNFSTVCVSQVDTVGTTDNLLRKRKLVTSACENMESCKVDMSLTPFIDSIYDVYGVFVRVFYNCINDSDIKPKSKTEVSVVGWIVAGFLTILLLVAIIVIALIYKKKMRNEVNMCAQVSGARPLPTLPGASGNYTTLSQRRIEDENNYDKLTTNGCKLEDSDYHEYLEPVPDVIKKHDGHTRDIK